MAWARVYERRGPTFSDVTRVERAELVKRLKAGKKYVIGQRILLHASEFVTSQALQLVQQDGREFVTLESSSSDSKDDLKGAPVV